MHTLSAIYYFRKFFLPQIYLHFMFPRVTSPSLQLLLPTVPCFSWACTITEDSDGPIFVMLCIKMYTEFTDKPEHNFHRGIIFNASYYIGKLFLLYLWI
jgi:hypothetical protein